MQSLTMRKLKIFKILSSPEGDNQIRNKLWTTLHMLIAYKKFFVFSTFTVFEIISEIDIWHARMYST